MDRKWIGAAAGNFRPGRPAGLKPEIIVLHTVDGTLAEAASRYNNGATPVSTHYAVGAGGEVHQFVKEEDTAFHAGVVVNPASALVAGRPKTNPNFYSIGIDFEGKADTPLTPEQSSAGAALLGDVASRWGIPLDAAHVLPHSAIRASVNCPGSAWNPAQLLAAASVPVEVRTPAAQEVKLITRVNLRRQPSLAAPVIRTLAAGETVGVAGFADGDTVSGNAHWFINPEGYYFWAGATDNPAPDLDPAATTDESDHPPPPAPGAEPPINRQRFRFNNLQPGKPKKDLIVLHFTAGSSAASAAAGWTQHVAVPYVIDLDGTIYELFDPACWAFHLGIKGDPHHVQDMRSIGIEIANAGPLKKVGSQMNWWPPAQQYGTKFCDAAETGRYIPASFRNFDFFAAYPQPQVASVAALVSYLCGRFSIPKTLPPPARQFECDTSFYASYKGIATHANFRQDKWDIGPAFDWPALGI
jgi:N-acetyl-anhydromuramyl-L-alanine amidase AmpD